MSGRKKIIIITAFAVAAVLIACAALAIIMAVIGGNEISGLKVTDSGSDLNGVRAEIVAADLDAEIPHITVKWKNSTFKQYSIEAPFELYREVDDKWKKEELVAEPDDDFGDTLMELDSYEKDYLLKHFELSEGEKYRFEVKVSVNEAEYKVWIEFEICEKVSRYYFNATVLERVYDRDENGRDTGYLIVAPFEDEPERKSSDKIQVYCDTVYSDNISEFIDEGSFVRILYDGRIEETYPAKLPTVYEIEQIFVEEETSESFDATVINVTTSSFLVTPLEGERELSVSDKIYVNKEDLDSEMDAGITEGSIVRISYDGRIEETYPAKIPKVYKIEYLRGSYGAVTEPVPPLVLTKDSIPNTKDWQTKGLESAGLSGVEIGEPYSATFGDLYVLKHYNISSVYYDIFFAIETKDTVYLQKINELSMISLLNICDLDGEYGDEICIQEYTGNAVKTTTVFSADDGKLFKIFSSAGETRLDTGFTFELCAPYRVEIKNKYTGYEAEYNFSDENEEYKEAYDNSGKPLDNQSVWLWHTAVSPIDTDGDGVYELLAKQNTCLLSNADNFGECVSVLKYDKKAKGFKVIDAKFVSVAIPESIPNTDGWQSKLFVETIFDPYNTEISEPYIASFGNLFVISMEKEARPLREIYFGIENGDEIIISQVTSSGYISNMDFCNVDGIQGDEVIVSSFNGGVGGAGGYDSYIFRVNKGVLDCIFFANRGNNENSGFESRLIAPFSLEITNKYTGYRYVKDLKDCRWMVGQGFDENGVPISNFQANLDNIDSIETKDLDGDGVYELICRQYTSFGSTADYIGYAMSTWEYDEDEGEFIVIDTEFISYMQQ